MRGSGIISKVSLMWLNPLLLRYPFLPGMVCSSPCDYLPQCYQAHLRFFPGVPTRNYLCDCGKCSGNTEIFGSKSPRLFLSPFDHGTLPIVLEAIRCALFLPVRFKLNLL